MTICSIDDSRCTPSREVVARDLCGTHYGRWRLTGTTDDPIVITRFVPGRTPTIKQCTYCKEIKSYTEFSNREVSRDGLCYWCRDCSRTESKRRREARKPPHLRRRVGQPGDRKEQLRRRRAAKRKTTVAVFTDKEIFDRDGWVCGICHESINPLLQWPDPLSVSLDHIWPLSLNGPHIRGNVRAAHLGCNMRKSNKIPDDIARLIW